uniref:F-box domain-containing protein n=1 Tax=Schizophyllum commune (strain H4-8 / FGSC 9210) TaxID=578458 RepID=D8PV87_SCHCM
MILNLPTELALHTLLFVDLPTIYSLQLVCKPWAEFIRVNESTVYHNVVASQNLIPSPSTLLEDLPRWYSSRSLEGVASWKAFCRRRVDIIRSWRGRAPANTAVYKATGTRVHRIKVDELYGYVITTSADGGLQVTDIVEDEVLWALPKTYVRGWAHVEYADGFIIFDRRDGHKEIWRRASDAQDSTDRVVEESAPDERQLVASKNAAEQYRSTSNRGHFVAWALISPGGITTAFRAVYPVLLTASDHQAFVFDVRTGARLHKLTNPQAPTDPDMGHLNYVEISDRHVFTCDSNVLRVYARADGRCVFEIFSNKEYYGQWLFAISRTPPQEQVEGALVVHPVHAFERHAPEYFASPICDPDNRAAHVSKCGRHLVGALSTARIVVVYNFERALRGEAQLFDLAFEVQLGSGRTNTKYLAFEDDRICVATGRGIFVVHVLEPPTDSTTRPRIIVTRVPWFNDPHRLNAISCLQMSDTGIWFNWQSRPEEDSPEMLEEHEIEFYTSAENSAYRTRLPGGHIMVLAAEVHSVNFGIPS